MTCLTPMLHLGSPAPTGQRPRPDGDMPSKGRLVAVIATHNRLASLSRALDALLESTSRDLAAIVVVDNASSDQTWSMLCAYPDPRVLPIRMARNQGGAGAFATAIKFAMSALDPDWLLIMDDDAWPETGAIAAFHSTDHHGADMIAAAVYAPDGTIMEMNRPSQNPFWDWGRFWATARYGRAGFHIPHSAYHQTAPHPIDVTSFVGLFVSRAIVTKIGTPNPKLFVSGEDGIYTLAATKAGFSGVFLPQIRFRHACKTFSGAGGGFYPVWKAYFYHRNLMILYRQAAGIWFWAVLLVILPKWILKARRQVGNRGAYLTLLALAIWDGLLHNLSRDPARLIARYQRDKIT